MQFICLSPLPIRVLHQIESVLGVMWLPWVQELGGGSAKWYSVVATGSYVLRYVVNHELAKRSKPENYMSRIGLALALMACGSLVCVFANNVWMALFGIWTMAGARGAFLPAVQVMQHEKLNDKVRTTGLSAINFFVDAIVALSYFGASVVIERLTVQSAWSISAICFGVAGIVSLSVMVKSKKYLAGMEKLGAKRLLKIEI